MRESLRLFRVWWGFFPKINQQVQLSYSFKSLFLKENILKQEKLFINSDSEFVEIEAILVLVQPTYLQHYIGEQWFPRHLHAVLEATSLSYCFISALMAFPTKQSVLPPALLWHVLTKKSSSK